MRKTHLFILLSTITLFAFAGGYNNQRNDPKGTIILNDGTSYEGYIIMKGSETSPWGNQTSVRYYSEDALADGKVKGKEKVKYKPSDLKAYFVNDRYFETIKISYGKLTIGMGINKNRFVERLVEGKINLYKLYEEPEKAGVYSGEAAIAEHEQELERMRNEPLTVIQKDGGEYFLSRKTNLSELLAECTEIQEKYDNGGYGVEPFNPDAKSKLGKFIANSANAQMLESVMPEMVTDYNECLK